MCAVALAIVVVAAVLVAPGVRAANGAAASPAALAVSQETRLVVVAPHPDDETLGAGGLMQRVRSVGGKLQVVYLTDGDGFPEGVRVHDRITRPSAADYRGYGQLRKREALAATAALKLGGHESRFLGFPDGGLSGLLTQYWSERGPVFQSPYTRQHRPAANEAVTKAPHYRGEDLTQELARLLGDFRPTMIVVPRKEDQHPDHCAASYFTDDALADITRVLPAFRVEVVNYLVHYGDWSDETEANALVPPADLDGGVDGWISFLLTKQELQNKHAALNLYVSQQHVMSWFLHTFARANELFSRQAPSKVVLPVSPNPCS